MAMFEYKGRTQTGELVEGKREAETSDVLAGQLSAINVIVFTCNISLKNALWTSILIKNHKDF